MARLVVTTAGTLGDFVPFFALAKTLRSRGHDVVMAVNPAMIARVESAGIEAIACGRPLGPEEVRQQADLFDRPEPATPEEFRAGFRRLDLARTTRDLLAACRGADAVVSASLQGVSSWVHELTGIPWITATIFAMEFPHVGIPLPDPPPYWPILIEARNAARAELGLPAVPPDGWKDRYWSRRLVLVASSPHFSRPQLHDHPQAVMTGFWFDGEDAQSSLIDPALRGFLDAGPPPLVLTYSSQPLRDPAAVLGAHVEAARRLGLRLVIQRGWAGFDPAMLAGRWDRRSVHFADHVPHDLLFRRALAVIHHGGIGSTAQALRQGRPALVEPHCNDQFFNAARIHELGAGTMLLPDQLTADAVEEALATAVLTPAARGRAEDLRQSIAAEDGLETAYGWIASILGA